MIADFKLFKADGAIQRSVSLPVTDNPGLLMSSRDEITRHTIEEARRLPRKLPDPITKMVRCYCQTKRNSLFLRSRSVLDAISFHFNTTIQQVDLNRQCVITAAAGSKDTSKVGANYTCFNTNHVAKLTATLQQLLQAWFPYCQRRSCTM